MKVLARKGHDGSKEDWNRAISFFNAEWRWHLANMAAHGRTIIECQEGDILQYSDINEVECVRVWRHDHDQEATFCNVSDEEIERVTAMIRDLDKSLADIEAAPKGSE